ncbi:hypothetical protein OUZ56_028137 [Daphnia magna]|uniref:Uncharacterized protein n=1 Tax=Daphnia magna TaxID=35525 RepID=A0ABR0B303_9CRUS|nr:hypothetical protein OUZ56_028137 [Daphnia magna]
MEIDKPCPHNWALVPRHVERNECVGTQAFDVAASETESKSQQFCLTGQIGQPMRHQQIFLNDQARTNFTRVGGVVKKKKEGPSSVSKEERQTSKYSLRVHYVSMWTLHRARDPITLRLYGVAFKSWGHIGGSM